MWVLFDRCPENKHLFVHITRVTEESATVVEKDLAVEKEGEATDANKETPVEAQAEKEPEDTVHYHLS